MATIATTVQLNNQMMQPLMGIVSSVNMVISAMEQMETASGNMMDMSTITAARNELNQANTQINRINEGIKDAENSTDRAASAQKKHNQQLQGGVISANSLMNMVGSIASAYTIKKVFDLSDTMTSNTARLNLMNDGLQTTKELQQSIYAAAQNTRGSYLDMTSQVAKLGLTAGDAFKSNQEIVAFAEQLNKKLVIGGASATEQAAATYQLTQAMASGRLQGDEYRSIIENAPLLANAIEDYMVNVQHAEGTMKDWASEGLLTADVIKNALFSVADETNERFESMPMTWAQVWAQLCNQVLIVSQPILNVINAMANNWEVIGPIVYGVAGAIGLYVIAMAAHNAITVISCALKVAHGALTADEAAATTGACQAQIAFNAALLACPLTWIIIIIIAVVAAIFALVAAYNKATGAHVSAVGIICGGLNVVAQFFKNLGLTAANVALGIWAGISALGGNIKAVFKTVIATVQSNWYDLLATCLTVVEGICAALNKIPFIEFDYSGISSAADNYAAKSAEAAKAAAGQKYTSVADAVKKGASTYETFGKGWAKDAYDAGYKWGADKQGKVSEFLGNKASDQEIDIPEGAGSIKDSAAKTAANTADISKKLDVTEQELKYIRDYAYQRAINRYTTREINITMTNHNSISSDQDLDGIVEALRGKITEEMNANAEGVY